MSEVARLEPIAEAGEVLISTALRFHSGLDENKFTFKEWKRALAKAVGASKAGDLIECYTVSLRSSGS